MSDDSGIEAVFSALASTHRVAIVRALWEDRAHRGCGLSVGDLAQAVEISRFGVSHHLQILRDVGLVTSQARGNRVVSVLDTEGIWRIWDWIDPLCAEESIA